MQYSLEECIQMGKTGKEITLNDRIARRIIDLRKKRNMSKTKFGDLVGVTYQQANNYEKGDIDFKISKLEKIAKALNISVMDLFGNHKVN